MKAAAVTLSPDEISQWLYGLAPTDLERLEILKNLISHRFGDAMSPEDLLICRAEAAKLRVKLGIQED